MFFAFWEEDLDASTSRVVFGRFLNFISQVLSFSHQLYFSDKIFHKA
jgi:hypothetical protein